MAGVSDRIDLLIRAGRVVCPRNDIDAPGAVAIRGDRIVSVETASTASRRSAAQVDRVLDFPDGLLLPGLVDLHAHPATAGSVFGVDPDRFMLPSGVTTVLSQGDAGAAGIDAYIETTVNASRTRVLLAINLSRIGESTPQGCFDRLADADVEACVAATKCHVSVVRAIAVNVSHQACGRTDPREILRRGLQAADRTDLPILFGMRRPEDWPLEEQLDLLRPGDIVTYSFRRTPHCIVENDRVLPCVRKARQRGVFFDVGHGMASFDFAVAESAIADGFRPDTISTDQQARHLEFSPRHDLPRTMSKLVASGMSEWDAFAAVTARPADILGLAGEVGSLTPGACADVTILQLRSDAAPHVDVLGADRPGGCWNPVGTVRSGRIVGENLEIGLRKDQQ